jgi:hypothetical protein
MPGLYRRTGGRVNAGEINSMVWVETIRPEKKYVQVGRQKQKSGNHPKSASVWVRAGYCLQAAFSIISRAALAVSIGALCFRISALMGIINGVGSILNNKINNESFLLKSLFLINKYSLFVWHVWRSPSNLTILIQNLE